MRQILTQNKFKASYESIKSLNFSVLNEKNETDRVHFLPVNDRIGDGTGSVAFN